MSTNGRMTREGLAAVVNPLFSVYGRMTVRQVYYQLVSKQIIENSVRRYKAFDALLTRCREDGLIDPGMFIDGSRPMENFDRYGFAGLKDYLRTVKDGYRRDPLEGQKYQVELWIEKDALRRFIMRGLDLPLPNLATRGYSPYTLLYEAERRAESGPLVILQLGDHDPSGEDLYRHIRERLPEVTVERVALTPEQVRTHGLRPIPTKPGDTRQRGFVARHGDAAVELDALPPDALTGLVQEAVDRWIDLKLVDSVEEEETDERALWQRTIEGLENNL